MSKKKISPRQARLPRNSQAVGATFGHKGGPMRDRRDRRPNDRRTQARHFEI